MNRLRSVPRAAIVPTAWGGWFSGGSTVTAMFCVAFNPPGSVAVTVTVALPADTGWMVTSEPDTVAVATRPSLDSAT